MRCIAFHSYKGGTGKTTIASNCAALLAKRGFKVALLDLDVYAPSLLAYFQKKPSKWLNDYLLGEAEVEEVMTPVTDAVKDLANAQGDSEIRGDLWIAFCNVKKEEVYKMETSTADGSKSQLRRFILLRERLIRDYGPDFIIIDTSPGIRYWSVNALAVADTLFLTLKMGDIDVEGTKRLASEIYGSLTKYGTKSYLLFNRVAGYCTPGHGREADPVSPLEGATDRTEDSLARDVKMDIISEIPCYCDIQFSRKEFLTALRYPDHPFTRKLETLADSMADKL